MARVVSSLPEFLARASQGQTLPARLEGTLRLLSSAAASTSTSPSTSSKSPVVPSPQASNIKYTELYKEFQLKWNPPQKIPVQSPPKYRAPRWDEQKEVRQQFHEQLTYLGLSQDAASAVITSMKKGRLPCDYELVQQRASHLQSLERRFAGLNASATLEQDPRVLRYDEQQLVKSLAVFQDEVPDLDAGEALPYLGDLLVSQPALAGQRLNNARKLLQGVLGAKAAGEGLLVQQVLRVPEVQLQTRLQALLHLLGKEVASKVLQWDASLLAIDHEIMASAVRRLRWEFKHRAASSQAGGESEGAAPPDPIVGVNQQLLQDSELLRSAVEQELSLVRKGNYSPAPAVLVAPKRVD